LGFPLYEAHLAMRVMTIRALDGLGDTRLTQEQLRGRDAWKITVGVVGLMALGLLVAIGTGYSSPRSR